MKSLRLNRFETKRLVWALELSIAVHLLIWGGYELGQKTGLWQRIHLTARTHLAEKKKTPPVQDSDPSIFLDVDPDQMTPDAPKNAKYYSSKNSHAAQTEASREENQPKLNGKQTDVPNTKEVPHTPNTKVQSAPAPQPPSPEKLAAMKSMLQAGDLRLAKLETSPEKNEATPERPRTLNQARAQQQASPRPQIQMQQDGGTRRRALVAAFDSKATAFGDYDAQMFGAIQQYWDDQLSNRQFAQDRSGRVTLRFRLNYDGSVSDMEVLNNEVGDLLGYVCQQAIIVPSPFAKWPSDMRRETGDKPRQMTVTFIYY